LLDDRCRDRCPAERPAWPESAQRNGTEWPVVPGFLIVMTSDRGCQNPPSNMSPGDTTSTAQAVAAGQRFLITEIRCGPDSTEFP
jgi:hypothetical protein